MQIKKNDNRYDVIEDNKLVAQISDVRKFGLHDINGNHWHLVWKSGTKTKHRTLKEAKQKVKEVDEFEFPEDLSDVYGAIAD